MESEGLFLPPAEIKRPEVKIDDTGTKIKNDQLSQTVQSDKIAANIEDQEKIESMRSELDLESKNDSSITTTRQAVDKLMQICTAREPYSIEQAKAEQPFTHYSNSGNIFQILRYGI